MSKSETFFKITKSSTRNGSRQRKGRIRNYLSAKSSSKLAIR